MCHNISQQYVYHSGFYDIGSLCRLVVYMFVVTAYGCLAVIYSVTYAL